MTIANGIILVSPDSVIEADSRTGADGTVAVLGVVGSQTTESEALPLDFFNAFALIDDECVATVTGGSALTREGRGGAPFTGASQPALFGGAIAYPGGGGDAAAPAPAPAAVEAPASCLAAGR